MPERTEREELARAIFIADNANALDAAREWDWADEGRVEYAYDIADGLLTAGYRKPQQVTTVEELNALPEGSIILDSKGWAWQKRDAGNDPLWHAARAKTRRVDSAYLADREPFTVLHTPEDPR